MNAIIPLIIVVLIAVNALYVAAEFAAVSVRRSRVQALAEDGNTLAQQLAPILNNPARLDRYIAACQIGITISSLVLGAYGQATIPGVLGPWLMDLGLAGEAAAQSISAVIVLIFLTSVQVILGELVPKSLALQFATQVALYTALPMRWSLVVLRPFIAVLNGSGLAVLRLFGTGEPSHGHVHSPEEIELLIVQSGDGGLLEPDERARLRRALRLGERRAHQIMVPRTRMAALDADLPPDELEQQVTESPYTRFPVYRESIDNVIGMLHSRDLTVQLTDGRQQLSIERLLRPMVIVPDSAPVYRVLSTLQEARAHQAIVTDEFGGVAGLLTLDDVLDEVFGDVGDEYARAEPQPLRLPDGRLRVRGDMLADEAAPYLGIDLPGAGDTVGGRVVEALGHLPEPGETVEIEGVRFEVEAVEHYAIVTVIAGPDAGEADEDD